MWQPYADYLVYIALMALPWGGPDLAEGAPQDLERLLAEVGKYVALRPASHTPALRPFFEGEDTASLSDSGAASFLGQVALHTSAYHPRTHLHAACHDYCQHCCSITEAMLKVSLLEVPSTPSHLPFKGSRETLGMS